MPELPDIRFESVDDSNPRLFKDDFGFWKLTGNEEFRELCNRDFVRELRESRLQFDECFEVVRQSRSIVESMPSAANIVSMLRKNFRRPSVIAKACEVIYSLDILLHFQSEHEMMLKEHDRKLRVVEGIFGSPLTGDVEIGAIKESQPRYCTNEELTFFTSLSTRLSKAIETAQVQEGLEVARWQVITTYIFVIFAAAGLVQLFMNDVQPIKEWAKVWSVGVKWADSLFVAKMATTIIVLAVSFAFIFACRDLWRRLDRPKSPK